MKRATMFGAIAAAGFITATSASADFIPWWIAGGSSGYPVIGVAPGTVWRPYWFSPPIGCYFTRVRANNRWQRAQICDYIGRGFGQ